LIKAGAKMPEKAPNGLSVVLLATYGRDLAGVRQVLETGAPLDGRDKDGWTALEVASYYGDRQIAMDLLRAVADASLKDSENKTALDRAKENEDIEMIALLGGPWNKTAPKGGSNLSIPCTPLGGKVDVNFALDGTALVVTTAFPKPLNYYIGGGNVNRSSASKKFTYEGSFSPTYTLDVDSKKYAIDYSQYGTSVSLAYKDSKGNERTKSVYANVLDVDIQKDGQDVDTSELGDDTPRPLNDNGVLVTRVPLTLVSLAPGKTFRVNAKIGSCEASSGKIKLQ
jgi:ankyrin repeat protein